MLGLYLLAHQHELVEERHDVVLSSARRPGFHFSERQSWRDISFELELSETVKHLAQESVIVPYMCDDVDLIEEK